jgi:hypothetical protein
VSSPWPRRHPVFTDQALSPFASAAQAAVPQGRVLKVLRHVPGRRVTSLVEAGGHRLVVKVHAHPVAGAAAEQLRILAQAGLAGVTPYPRAIEADGHVAALTFHPGTLLHELDDRQLLGACVRVGAALRRLHDCRAAISRRWTEQDELDRAGARSVEPTGPALEELRERSADLPEQDLVVSHRHCRPGHLVVDGGGSVRLVDLDAVALAPRGLDVGNLLAHLHRDGLRGVRRPAVAAAAGDAFLLGYGRAAGLEPETVGWWRSVALLRLAGLAQLRRQDGVERDLLIDAAAGRAPQPLATPA